MTKKKSNDVGVNIGKEISKMNIVTGFGFTIIANILVSIIIGMFLDNMFGTGKIFLIIFVFLGLASGIYNGIRYMLKEVEKYEKEEQREQKSKNDEK